MTNENLKNALQQAGLTPEEFAGIIGVDPKTVQRWVAGTTTPYRRHRAAISRALARTEQELWPDQEASSAANSGLTRGGSLDGGDITSSWGYATDPSVPDPFAFISNANGAIEILDNDRGIELSMAVVHALLEQASAGRRVRLLTGAPTLRLEPLIDHQQVEIRIIHSSTTHSLIRTGDVMMITFNLAAEADQPPPLLKLTRTTNGGLFDRLADNLKLLWDDADEHLADAKQLADYATNTDEGIDEIDTDQVDPYGPAEQAAGKSSTAEQPAETAIRTETDQTRRRWPRQSN